MPSPLNTCPTYPVLFSTVNLFHQPSFFFHSLQDVFICYFILIAYLFHPSPYPHLRTASLLISSSFRVHVSQPYSNVVHTKVFTILFLTTLLNLFVNSSFLLLNASLPSAILVLLSISHLPFSVIVLPKYLNNLLVLSCFY